MGAGLLLFLKGVNPKVWLYLGIAALVAIYTAAVFYQGGVGPRAELDRERALHQAEVAKLEAQQESEKGQSDVYIAQSNFDHAENIDRVNKDWMEWVAKICPLGLDAHGLCIRPRSGPIAEPVRVTSGVCDNQAGNDRLSDALQEYRSGIRRLLRDERDENRRVAGVEREKASRLLKTCQLQTGSLVEVQDWAATEKRIHDRRGGNLILPQ